jgi:hypothetical protein
MSYPEYNPENIGTLLEAFGQTPLSWQKMVLTFMLMQL